MKTIILLLGLASTFEISAQTDLISYGRKILANEVKPTDDKQTFQIIDSLLCKNKADKDFYFNVFNKIQQISDGALSEHVGTIARKYYFNKTAEFIKNSNNMTTKAIYRWLDFVAFDLYADSKNDQEDLPNIKVKLDSLEKKLPDSSTEKIKCKTFNDYLYRKTIDFMKAG